MSGQEAIRGFAVQTLICVLDAFRTGGPQWHAVTLEPDIAGDKVDIFWEYADYTLAQQVKSSKNQIGKAATEAWCQALVASRSADKYELILAGPIASAVLDDAPFHGVAVPIPASMDTLALIDQAVTRLDRYLLANGFPEIPLPMRESMISLISARLLDGSIRGERFTKAKVDGWIHEQILLAYPSAIKQRLATNCDVLWNSFQLLTPPMLGQNAFDLALPLTFINSGLSVAIVEWVLLKVTNQELRMLYEAKSITSMTGERSTDPELPFGEVAVNPGTANSVRLILTPVRKDGFDIATWTDGGYDLELWIKYASNPGPIKQREAKITLSIDDKAAPSPKQSKHISLGSISAFLETL